LRTSIYFLLNGGYQTSPRMQGEMENGHPSAPFISNGIGYCENRLRFAEKRFIVFHTGQLQPWVKEFTIADGFDLNTLSEQVVGF
jgi:hypothetical protein